METDPADSVLFGNATNATSDITNALALDMTYRVLYYGTGNKVRKDGACLLQLPRPLSGYVRLKEKNNNVGQCT